MKSIVEILMDRDGITKEEAIELYEEVRRLIKETGYQSYDEIEDILMEYLGLEMDYIFEFI